MSDGPALPPSRSLPYRWLAFEGGSKPRAKRVPTAPLPPKPHVALVHGDLWSGNAHALADGRFALIDPAAYAGHYEVDLALSELFGGFAPEFYTGYRGVVPEARGGGPCAGSTTG